MRLTLPVFIALGITLAAPGSPPGNATELVRALTALDTVDFVAVRTVALLADKLDTLALVLKSANPAARDSWLARLPDANRARYEERMEKLGPAGPDAIAGCHDRTDA
jgi:hypothetical protein